MSVWACMPYVQCGLRRTITDVGSLSSLRFPGSRSRHQARQQAPLPAESFCRPLLVIKKWQREAVALRNNLYESVRPSLWTTGKDSTFTVTVRAALRESRNCVVCECSSGPGLCSVLTDALVNWHGRNGDAAWLLSPTGLSSFHWLSWSTSIGARGAAGYIELWIPSLSLSAPGKSVHLILL